MLIVPHPLATLPIFWTVNGHHAVAPTSGSALHASPSQRVESLLYSFHVLFPEDLREEGVASVQNVKHSPVFSLASCGHLTDLPSVIMSLVVSLVVSF